MMRIFGAIGMPEGTGPEALDQVMRLEGYMRVEPGSLPVDYPFVEFEKCDFFVVKNDGPFGTILLFEAWERVFARAMELSRITGGPVFALRCNGKEPDCLKIYDSGDIAMKIGPDDDDERGLLAPETEPDQVAETLTSRLGIRFRGDGSNAWAVAAALSVPDVERAHHAGGMKGVSRLAFLSVDSPIA